MESTQVTALRCKQVARESPRASLTSWWGESPREPALTDYSAGTLHVSHPILTNESPRSDPDSPVPIRLSSAEYCEGLRQSWSTRLARSCPTACRTGVHIRSADLQSALRVHSPGVLVACQPRPSTVGAPKAGHKLALGPIHDTNMQPRAGTAKIWSAVTGRRFPGTKRSATVFSRQPGLPKGTLCLAGNSCF